MAEKALKFARKIPAKLRRAAVTFLFAFAYKIDSQEITNRLSSISQKMALDASSKMVKLMFQREGLRVCSHPTCFKRFTLIRDLSDSKFYCQPHLKPKPSPIPVKSLSPNNQVSKAQLV